MQTNFKTNTMNYIQTLQGNDYVRNSLQNINFERSNYYQNTSPIKSVYPYENLVSPKNHLKTPFFTIPCRKSNQDNFNFNSFKNEKFVNQYQKNQSQNVIQNSKKYFEMQNTISQLKISLHQSLDNQGKLQQQLHHERTKNFQLFQLKRRLQEQLSKMQFQLDRINSQDNLQQRQALIKRQSVQAQNQSLSRQIQDLHEQLKKIKKQHRDLMTQYNHSMSQCQNFSKQNKILVEKVQLLESQINYSRNQINNKQNDKSFQKGKSSFNYNKNKQMNRFQIINQIATTRTDQQNNQSTNPYQPDPYTVQTNQIKYFNSPQTTKPNSKGHQSYNRTNQLQNSKLIEDYQKLLIENQSMKKLCEQFYQGNNLKKQQNQKNELLKTYQRNSIQRQINSLRQEVINQLITKYYQKTLKQSKIKNKNCLIIFIQQISNKIQVLDKMVLNYLMARDILKKQTLSHEQHSFSKDGDGSIQFQQLIFKVKQNLKNQLKKNRQKTDSNNIFYLNINSYFLALFRLLTLIYRGNQSNNQTGKYIKHLCLKYIHKIADQRRKM